MSIYTTEEFINDAKCELHMTVGDVTKIEWTGNGTGRFMAVLSLVETLANMTGTSFEEIILALCQAHNDIEQAEVDE